MPQALKAINENPAVIFASTPARWIDFQAYVVAFAGTSFLSARSGTVEPLQRLEPHPDRQRIAKNGRPPATSNNHTPGSSTSLDETKALSQHNYERFFTEALNIEQDALWSESEDHALYQVHILQASGVIDPRPSMYRYVCARSYCINPTANKSLSELF